jgi:hypothetical protein
MYDTTFRCTYQLIENYKGGLEGNEHKKYDEIDINNLDDISDDLYRSQFMQAFQLTNWNEILINQKLDFLQKTLENDNMGKIILETMKEYSKFPIDNVEVMLLCSYDYFYLFHNCIIELINNKCISENTFHLLINKIKHE